MASAKQAAARRRFADAAKACKREGKTRPRSTYNACVKSKLKRK